MQYTDVARLLTLYQFWLDDLYPRAKFADGLAIIEKLGHTKHMQLMRRDWIKEGKPVERERDEERRGSAPNTAHSSSDPMDVSFGQEGRNGGEGGARTAERDLGATNTNVNGNGNAERRKPAGEESLFFSEDEGDVQPRLSKKAPEQIEGKEFDDLDALLVESFERAASATTKPTAPATSHDDPPDDDLDTLLAEDAMNTKSGSKNSAAKPAPPRDDFDDEMEAMADMDMNMGGEMW